MSAEITTQNTKIWRKSFMLFGFQCVSGLLMAVLAYVLTDVIKIFPGSFMAHGSSIPATIFGAYCYGYWEEKRNPGILNMHLIKKICCRAIFWQILLTLFVFLLIIAVQPAGKPLDVVFVIFMSLFFILLSLIYYWATLIFIKRGIATRHKNASKPNQLGA